MPSLFSPRNKLFLQQTSGGQGPQPTRTHRPVRSALQQGGEQNEIRTDTPVRQRRNRNGPIVVRRSHTQPSLRLQCTPSRTHHYGTVKTILRERLNYRFFRRLSVHRTALVCVQACSWEFMSRSRRPTEVAIRHRARLICVSIECVESTRWRSLPIQRK